MSIQERSLTPSNLGGQSAAALSPAASPDHEETLHYQQYADEFRGTGGERSSNFLAGFSMALGAAQFLAPSLLCKAVGIREPTGKSRATMRLMGLRELGHGVSIMSNRRPAAPVSARLACDMLDLALLAGVMANPKNDRARGAMAFLNVAAVTALDAMTARQLQRQPETEIASRMKQGYAQVRNAITIDLPVEEVYAFWRNFENLPRFMRHLESVTVLGPRRSRWVASGPAGKPVEWEAEITEERENELISWRSVEGSEVYNAGSVRFDPAPGDRGTEVRLSLEYDPPFGKFGQVVAKIFGEEPGLQSAQDLRNFKQVMEIGEVIFSDSSKRKGPHPSMPDEQSPKL